MQKCSSFLSWRLVAMLYEEIMPLLQFGLHKFMLAIILSPILSSKFSQVGPCYFLPSFARWTSFIVLFIYFCSHVHLYWPAHRQYAFWYMTLIPCKLAKLQGQLGIVSLTDASFFITSSSAGFCLLSRLGANTTMFQKLVGLPGRDSYHPALSIFCIDICSLGFHWKFFFKM